MKDFSQIINEQKTLQNQEQLKNKRELSIKKFESLLEKYNCGDFIDLSEEKRIEFLADLLK